MKIRSILIVTIFLAFSACSNHDAKKDVDVKKDESSTAKTVTDKVLPVLDTTILLLGAKGARVIHRPVKESEATFALYKYFAKQGIGTRSKTISSATDSAEKVIVDYDTLYQLQTERFSGGIISYWLGPPDLNGHCFQPRKAVILYTKIGLAISDKEFIPTNFTMDSVIKSTVYGYDYEGGGRGVIRNLRIQLR